MITAGIDVGSRSTKVVVFDAGQAAVIATGIVDQGLDQEQLAQGLFQRLLAEHGLPPGEVGRVLATGYGRNLIRFAHATLTEITCHACGVWHAAPGARTVIEIGGQDSKWLRLDAQGRVRDFAMNDRCAAGTGRFLEMVAARLGVRLQELGPPATPPGPPTTISSMCVVFAETEIVGLLASGTPAANIVAGVQAAIARRVATMAGRAVEAPVYFTGGVALVPGMAEAFAAVLGQPVQIVPQPLFTGALGAAILADEIAG